MAEKTAAELLREELCYQPKNTFRVLGEDELKQADEYCVAYKTFLDNAKTEREAVSEAVKLAEANGFVPFDPAKPLKAGDKVYVDNRGKALLLAVIGTRPLSEGVSIAAAHVDSPRLDLKPNPLYEDHALAYLDTHYYGGIKKYQWMTIPLALHGVVVRKDGSRVTVCIGESADDPVLCITDLLPHLGANQMKKTAAEFIGGEEMNILIGSRPLADEEGADAVKLNILKLLNEKYGITETDFLSAELEAVPAYKARDVGLDRSMIGSYGHDDRVCAYTALTALFALQNPAYTAVAVLADKEEIGSEGNTGMQSAYLRYFIEDIAEALGTKARHVFRNSLCLSADVNVAYDPLYPDTVESRNCAALNQGVVLTKYTGARGKSDTSDASAELMGFFRRIMDNADVVWQIGELGKVDLGVPVLSMHAPFEVVSKQDVYMTYKAFYALLSRDERL